ncbi:MAG: DUF6701 domain-containing protein [Shewanella sp.]
MAWLPSPLIAFQAIDYARYFPSVLQGHHGNDPFCSSAGSYHPQLTLYKGLIRGTNGAPLAFCSSTRFDGMNASACDDGKGGFGYCEITGADLAGIDFTLPVNQFKPSSGTGGIGWGECKPGQVLGADGKHQFKEVILSNPNCSLSFSPDQSEYRIKSLVLKDGPTLNLVPGDYWVDSFSVLYQASPIKSAVINVIGDGEVRIFINQNSEVSAPIQVVPQGSAKVVLVAYNNLSFHAGDTKFNGYIYSNKALTINHNSIFMGRFTARKVSIHDASTLIDRQFTEPTFHIQFGKATSQNVVFDRPFAKDVKPLVFLMPTIATTNTNNDGPASVFLNQVSNSGFSWLQKQPPKSTASAVAMPEVHWIAVTPGTHVLPSGKKLHAGSVAIDKAVNLHPYPWTKKTLDPNLKVHINQLQTQNNACWLTSIGLPYEASVTNPNDTGLLVSLDTSEVFSDNINPSCQPGNIHHLQPETVGYLAVEAGSGVMPVNGVDVRYQFSKAITHVYHSDLAQQCSYYTNLTGFEQAPIVVASKTSNAGPDGGWLRRCRLTHSELSVVVDEDTYKDNERKHVAEFYDFIAFGSVGQNLIDHFEFDHTGQGLTCDGQVVTMRACANASCSQLFTAPVTATLLPDSSANGVWVGGNQVSFNGGTATLQLRRNTPGVVALGVKASTPATKPSAQTLCRIGSGGLSVNNCSLTFADSGFVFDVPDKWANKPVGVLVKAVKKSDVTQQCVPSFQNQTKTLNFWSGYHAPSAPITPKAITINNVAIGTASTSPTPVNLLFDTNGQASISVNYPDAGKIQLDAHYIGRGSEQDLVMTGADQFVSVPAGLCVKAVEASASCPTADMSCNSYRKAGQAFGMTVQAMAWEKDGDTDFCLGNVPTPNFSDAQMQLASRVVAPSIASGGHHGALGVASYNHIAQANNLNTISNQSISEVGVFQIAAQATPNYLGAASSLNIPLGYSANIGRFVPDRFLVGDVSVLPACGNFSYMDQPFPMSMSIKALNIAGAVTQNYFPPFSLATAKLVGENNHNGIDLQSRLSTLPITKDSWNQGVATVDGDYRANVSRVTPNIAANQYQDGPFELLDIGVQLMDNDPRPNGLYSTVASADMDAASMGACTSCTAKKISTQILRHGRVVMDNTYGPETEILNMPTRAEYWNGVNWILNRDDHCTTASYSLGSQVDNAGLGYHFAPALSTGQSIRRSGHAATFEAGQFDLLWRALASGATPYRGQVTAPLDVPAWLEWYWNWNGNPPAQLADPRASAFFGRYRGHDKIIYWRESH